MLNKQTTINLIAQVISFIVSLGIGFFLTPFIVENIGVDSYGYVGLANNLISYAQILTVALNSMAGRFITISISKEQFVETKKYFTSVFISNIILSIALTIPVVFGLLYLERLLSIPEILLTDVKNLFGLYFLNFLLSLLGAAFGVAVFAKNRLDLASIRDIVSNVLKGITLITAFSLFVPKLSYVALSLFVSSATLFIIDIFYTKKLLPHMEIKRKYFDLSSVKEILSSGIWNSFTHLSSVLSKGLNLLIANLYIGSKSMGYLSLATTIPSLILSLFGVLASVFAPQLFISYAQNDKASMQKQLISSIKLLSFFSSIPLAVFFAYGDVFYSLWVPNQDENLLHILSILICIGFTFSLPLEGIWNIFTAVNKVKQTSIFLFFNSIVTLVIIFIGLNLMDDPKLKLFVIASAESFVSFIRSLTFLPLYGAYCLNFKFMIFYPMILKNALSIAIVLSMSLFLKNILTIDNWSMLILAVFLTAIIAMILNTIILLGRHERRVLLNILLKRRNV